MAKLSDEAVEGAERFVKLAEDSASNNKEAMEATWAILKSPHNEVIFKRLKNLPSAAAHKGVKNLARNHEYALPILREICEDSARYSDDVLEVAFKHFEKIYPPFPKTNAAGKSIPNPLSPAGVKSLPDIVRSHKVAGESLAAADSRVSNLMDRVYVVANSDVNDALETYGSLADVPGYPNWFKNCGNTEYHFRGGYAEAKYFSSDAVGVSKLEKINDSRPNSSGVLSDAIDGITKGEDPLRWIEVKNWSEVMSNGNLDSKIVDQLVNRHIPNYANQVVTNGGVFEIVLTKSFAGQQSEIINAYRTVFESADEFIDLGLTFDNHVRIKFLENLDTIPQP